MTDKETDGPMTPVGVNHVVINVRDIGESHTFWTEVVGMRQVGELHPTPERPNPPVMRFYSGEKEGRPNHHDIALVENRELPPPPEKFSMFGGNIAINHIAITLPNRETWLKQLTYLQEKGIDFGRRVDHGMTHSLYIRDPNGYGVELLYELPREVWSGDINAALNYSKILPTKGDNALKDDEDVPFFNAAE